MKRKPIQQFEMAFTAGAFNLAPEATQDGASIQAERSRLEIERAESAEKQETIPGLKAGSFWSV